MGHIDIFYWKLAILCCILGILFLFLTTESLVQGKFRLPAWVFSIFTCAIGVFFLRIFINSLNEFNSGNHQSIDQLLDAWKMISNFMTW